MDKEILKELFQIKRDQSDMTNFMQCVILDFILDKKGKKEKGRFFISFVRRTFSEQSVKFEWNL